MPPAAAEYGVTRHYLDWILSLPWTKETEDKIDLTDAERILNRTQALSGKNYATEADLTKSQARAGVLSAQLRQAQAQLAAARVEAQRFGEVLGKQVIGRIVADRAGHAMHTALVSRLLKDRSLWEETTEAGQLEELPERVSAAPAHSPREA